MTRSPSEGTPTPAPDDMQRCAVCGRPMSFDAVMEIAWCPSDRCSAFERNVPLVLPPPAASVEGTTPPSLRERDTMSACEYAKSDTTPCVARDGEASCDDDGRCFGCYRRGVPLPAAVAPPSAPPADNLCENCDASYEKHAATGMGFGVYCEVPPSYWEHATVAPPETTAPTATEPNEYQTGPCKCGHSHNLRLGGDVVQGCDMHGCRCKKFRAVSPVASSATPTPEPTLEAYRLAPSGEGPLADEWKDKPHRLVYDLVSALASSQQEVERLTAAINTAIGHLGAMNERPDRVQWDEIEGIQDALFAALAKEPR